MVHISWPAAKCSRYPPDALDLAGAKKKVICAFASKSVESLVTARELTEAGELEAVIDRVDPLEQAAEAHRYYETGQQRGEIVLTIGQSDIA
jgi:NADPH:quinone reductase-like Zn-dependent oxidoreductase